MAHMQGANAVVAQHEKSLEKDQVSVLLFRQLKLSNVGNIWLGILQFTGAHCFLRFFTLLENLDLHFTSARCGNP
jgi:hypothetical protein